MQHEHLIKKILEGDISVFQIRADLTDEDKKSLLGIHAAFYDLGEEFTYLEIGSNVGGSLQPFLIDDLCRKIYSIDKRPMVVPDERGLRNYSSVTTQTMMQELRRFYPDCLGKLQCFDHSSDEISKDAIQLNPSLCFIDG